MFTLFSKRAIALMAVVLLSAVACGDSGESDATEAPAATQAAPTATDAPGDGAPGTTVAATTTTTAATSSPAGAGTATITVSTGTYELELDGACVMDAAGIMVGAEASSDAATLFVAGAPEAAVIAFDLLSGPDWYAAAAAIAIDGSTMTYEGPAIESSGDASTGSTMSVTVVCAEIEGGG